MQTHSANQGKQPQGREGNAFVFCVFLSIFVYFANYPSHWDGNPGIGIANTNNPKQSQFRQKPGDK